MEIKDQTNEIYRKKLELRNYQVVKANDLIQKSRCNLNLQEQKILLYLISKIKPEDIEFKEYIFQIRDFCTICGLEVDSGKNYSDIKQTLKNLHDKSIWIKRDDGGEMLLSWIETAIMYKKSGKIIVKISNMMKPYLLQLKECFTQFELYNVLAMKSQYSIHLYELLKSYENLHKKTFEIDELKKLLSAENYTRFPDFQRFVLDRAMREIDQLSDLNVTYKIIKESRRFAKIEFTIEIEKDVTERVNTWARIEEVLDS